MVVTPGSTVMVRFAASTSRTASIFTVQSTMQSAAGTLPPLSPVPLPRVTTGVPVSLASFSTLLTCSVLAANTTQPGVSFNAAVPSNAYGMRSSLAVSTFPAPTRRRSLSSVD